MAVVTITKENFENEVLKSDKPVLLDFWATWCGPCRMVSPIVDEIANEHDDIKVGKINVDEQGELSMQFRIVSIPTLIVMKNGEVANKAVGAMPKEEILNLLGIQPDLLRIQRKRDRVLKRTAGMPRHQIRHDILFLAAIRRKRKKLLSEFLVHLDLRLAHV